MKSQPGNQLKLLIKILLTLVALTFALRQVSWDNLKTALATQNTTFLMLAFIAIIIQALLGGGRWYFLLRIFLPGQLTFLRTVHVYFASLFFNVCLPSTIGSDVSRIMMLRGHKADIIASVLFDRLFSFKSVALLLLLFLPQLFTMFGLEQQTGVLISIGCAVLGSFVLVLLYRAAPAIASIQRFAKLKPILLPLATLFHHPFLLLASPGTGVIAHIFYCICASLLAYSLGHSLSLMDSLTLVPFVMLASALPISIGGWGIRELGMTAALAMVGIGSAPAILIGLQLGIISTLINLFGGVFYLTQKQHKP